MLEIGRSVVFNGVERCSNLVNVVVRGVSGVQSIGKLHALVKHRKIVNVVVTCDDILRASELLDLLEKSVRFLGAAESLAAAYVSRIFVNISHKKSIEIIGRL